MRTFIIITPILLFSSCNMSQDLGTTGIIALFAILLLAMIAMIVFVAKKKKSADNTAAKFSYDMKLMIDKISDPKEKINALQTLIGRIDRDENYKKDLSWKNKVLSKVYQQIATVYYQMGNLDKIVETCTRILEVEPSHMMSYYNRGTIYNNKGLYQKAINDLTDAISLDNQYIDAYNNRGFAYGQMENFEKALADFNYVIASEPGAIVYYNRGNIFKALGDYNKALDDYTTALELEEQYKSGIGKELQLAMQVVNEKLK